MTAVDYYRIFTDAAVVIAYDGTVVKDSGEWKRFSNSYRYELPTLRSKLTELESELATEKEKVKMAEANRDRMARDLDAARADLNRELKAKSPEGIAAHVTELQTKLAKANAEVADCKRRLDAYGADVDLRVYVSEGKAENYREVLETERAARKQAEADLATARADVADLRSIAESYSAERTGQASPPDPTLPLAARVVELTEKLAASEALFNEARKGAIAFELENLTLRSRVAMLETAVDLRVKAAEDELTVVCALRDCAEAHLAESQKVVKSQSKALRDYERTYGPLPSAVSASLDEQDMDFKHGKPAGLTRQELIEACENASGLYGESYPLRCLAEELRK